MTRTASTRATFRLAMTIAALGLATSSFDRRVAATSPQPGVWTLVHSRPSGAKYEDFSFPTPSHGWLVAAPGDILHTTDGGVTWAVQATGKGRLRSVDFLDEKRGFAGTLTGVLWATTDGGETWTDVTGTLPKVAKGFCGMAHVGERVHIVGRYQADAADYFFSPDAGKTWRVTDLHDTLQGLVEIVFLNESVGFIGGMSAGGAQAAGPAAMLKTTDGGATWRRVFTHDGGRGFVWKIFPVTPALIYAALQSQDGTLRIAKSTDAGETWSLHVVATDRPQSPGIQGIGFIDEKTGWVGGFFQGMYGTTDGGETWAPVALPDFTFNRFERVNGRTLFTAGSRGILRYDAPATK